MFRKNIAMSSGGGGYGEDEEVEIFYNSRL